MGLLLVLTLGCIEPLGENSDTHNPIMYPVIESIASPVGEPTGDVTENSFIEAQLSITNAEASKYGGSLPKFGLLKGRSYVLKLIAEKVVIYGDGEMETNILLPGEFQVIDGELAWSGTDKKNTRQIIINPLQNGDYLINASVKNLDFSSDPTIPNGPAIYIISVSVRNTLSEAKEAIK